MVSLDDLPCWEIMECKETEECPARKNTDIPCWEIAKEIDDHRQVFNICIDCIVYILNTAQDTLTTIDIENIMEKKNICVLE